MQKKTIGSEVKKEVEKMKDLYSSFMNCPELRDKAGELAQHDQRMKKLVLSMALDDFEAWLKKETGSTAYPEPKGD